MDALKLAGMKGTKELLECLGRKRGTWSEIQKECSVVSHRVFNTRLKQLESQGFVSSKAEMVDKKATKIYSLTAKGKKLLGLIKDIGRL